MQLQDLILLHIHHKNTPGPLPFHLKLLPLLPTLTAPQTTHLQPSLPLPSYTPILLTIHHTPIPAKNLHPALPNLTPAAPSRRHHTSRRPAKFPYHHKTPPPRQLLKIPLPLPHYKQSAQLHQNKTKKKKSPAPHHRSLPKPARLKKPNQNA